MADVNPTLSVITFHENELNKSVKRQRFAEWTRKHDLIMSIKDTL